MRVAIDVGGTYTDLVFWHNGRTYLVKTPTTPESPVEGVLASLKILDDEITGTQVERLTHGTTLATNLLVEGKGVPAALITTEGFRDILALGRQKRSQLYALTPTKIAPLVKRRDRYEVRERVLADGSVATALDEAALESVLDAIAHTECRSVAICFLHAYTSPINEQRAAEAIRQRHPQWAVSLSSEIAPYFREYERFSTTVMNAYLKPITSHYFTSLEKTLARGKFPSPYIMKSDGGVMSVPVARERAVETLLSGPAGGVIGAAFVGQEWERTNLITLDIGGTTTDTALVVHGSPLVSRERELAGRSLQIPMLAIHTIGAGGGSVARISHSGLLKVGPDSAGASPGPVCYGQGGQDPTVTDAHLILGHIPLDRPGTKQPLNRDLATQVVGALGCSLNMTAEETASGILAVADHAIAEAVRSISIQRGYDPRDFTLVAGGGGGGLHVASVAKILSVPEVLIPREAAGLSALGLLLADVSREFVLTRTELLEHLTWDELQHILDKLAHDAREFLESEQIAPGDRAYQWSVDMRYQGQAYEVTVAMPEFAHRHWQQQLAERFHETHRQLYGHANHEQRVQLVSWRVVAVGHNPLRGEVGQRRMTGAYVQTPKTHRMVAGANIPVWDWVSLEPGLTLEGPALIDGLGTTVVVPSDALGMLNHSGAVVLTLPTGRGK